MKRARICIVCGDRFHARHGNARACSPECSAVRNLERTREYHREVRASDPAKFLENRDAEAILERRRARYRRGQAARRARLRGEDAAPQ